MQTQKPNVGGVITQENRLDIHKYTISELSTMIGISNDICKNEYITIKRIH
jgi:hypothetical protein